MHRAKGDYNKVAHLQYKTYDSVKHKHRDEDFQVQWEERGVTEKTQTKAVIRNTVKAISQYQKFAVTSIHLHSRLFFPITAVKYHKNLHMMKLASGSYPS